MKVKKIFCVVGLLFVAVFAFAAQPAWAQEATDCVGIGTAKYGQSLINKCDQRIVVFWCHDNPESKSRKSKCGYEGKKFQQHRALKPGQEYDNMYSLPPGAMLSYGACFGGWYSAEFNEKRDKFTCKK